MRIKLNHKNLSVLFEKSKIADYQRTELADLLGVTTRTLFDWKSGKHTIPGQSFDKLVRMSELPSGTLAFEKLNDLWHVSGAGRVGGKARHAKYGDLGDQESRVRGGNSSYLKRKNNAEDIFAQKEINIPERSESLAELIGIMIGDGTMNRYQVSVALSSIVDEEYSKYVVCLFERLFDVTPAVAYRSGNCITITISSIRLTDFLHSHGVLRGDKISQGLDIPSWIKENDAYMKACVRGMFDTDGCIYQEKHTYGKKSYVYPRWALVSASPALRTSLKYYFNQLSYIPKLRNNRSVNLERLTDIVTYFTVIGSNNPKHLKRWQEFGRVA